MRTVVFVFLATLVLGAPLAALGADGASLYAANCAKCHGENGAADTPVGKAMKAAALNDAKFADLDAAALKAILHDNPKHKSVVSKVPDEDLEALAEHIRKLAAAGS